MGEKLVQTITKMFSTWMIHATAIIKMGSIRLKLLSTIFKNFQTWKKHAPTTIKHVLDMNEKHVSIIF